jgi:hypothetical protein
MIILVFVMTAARLKSVMNMVIRAGDRLRACRHAGARRRSSEASWRGGELAAQEVRRR